MNSYTTGYQQYPSVAAAVGGDFVVVWCNSGEGDYNGIFGQRYDSQGVAQGGEFRVNSFTRSYQFFPSVTSKASGDFVVVWWGRGKDDLFGVFGQRYDSAGSALRRAFRINSYTTGGQGFPSVGAVGTDQFVVVWESNHQDGSRFGVFGQRFDFGSEATPPR